MAASRATYARCILGSTFLRSTCVRCDPSVLHIKKSWIAKTSFGVFACKRILKANNTAIWGSNWGSGNGFVLVIACSLEVADTHSYVASRLQKKKPNRSHFPSPNPPVHFRSTHLIFALSLAKNPSLSYIAKKVFRWINANFDIFSASSLASSSMPSMPGW